MGGKGSGKTQLVITLAKIADIVIKEGEETEEKQSIVGVCEGTGKSIGLQMILQETFSNTNVTIINLSGLWF